MTRENAILCLKRIKNYGRDIFTEQSDWQESLDMAIKALEQEPTIEYVQKIDKSAMMHEIYMSGVNITGEYQGCWVRFKKIEKIVDRYVR